MVSSKIEENGEKTFVNPLDEPRVSGSNTTNEKAGSENEFNELNVPPNIKEEDPQDVRKKHRGDKTVTLIIFLGLCLLLGTGYFLLKDNVFNRIKKEEAIQLHGAKIPKEQLLLFHSFVIPLKEKEGLTYISLSISFNVPNKELRQEMIEKKELLRGIMYHILRKEINRREEIPPIEKVKEFLKRSVNVALSAGKVTKISITKFLAV